MAPQSPPHHHHHRNNHPNIITTFASLFPHIKTPSFSPATTITTTTTTQSKIFFPIQLPFSESTQPHHDPSPNGPGFPSMVRIGGLRSKGGNGLGVSGSSGPAFVGQVFSMCDLSGTGLMAVSTHFHIPFLSKRTPEWIKKMFSAVTKKDSGPVFRFFVDLGDAVSYVKKLNIPSGVVGACRLDLAYEHFKEKPHLFQFVPNSKQLKAATKLLKGNKNSNRGRIDGVPVFSAQNLDIAIATPEGIKWYTPYFFDKNILDNILEESIDQHFHTLIQSRHVQRRRDVIDDNIAAEIIEESADSIWEPAEVQELMDEMGQPSIPLSVISKAAEMQLSYAVDKMLLGNKWLRKATGIQPKFPYMVDSFERREMWTLNMKKCVRNLLEEHEFQFPEATFESRRSAVSQLRAFKMATCSANSDMESLNELPEQPASTKLGSENKDTCTLEHADIHSPRRDWLRPPWLKPQHECTKKADPRVVDASDGYMKEEIQNSPLLPKITMVGIATTEPGQMNKATIKKTMEDLSKELEQEGQGNSASKDLGKNHQEDRDPLFVANVGDYYSNMGKTSSPRWLRGIHR